MPQNKKDNYGTLYGIRLRRREDKNIKNELQKLSEEKNIPLDQLILSYLEKGLCLDGEKEININKEELTKDFDLFLYRNTKKRIDSFENRLKMKNYEKKETLKNYIFTKLPDKIQRKKFYLELVWVQFYCEKQLLCSFFSFYDYTSSEFVGYNRYFCKIHDIPFNLDTLQENLDRYLDKFHLKWFYELKTAGIIRNQKHLREADFNYNALEKFIFELYKGEKLLYSPKERRIKSVEYMFNEDKKKETKRKGVYRHFKEIFREFVKFEWNLSNEILYMDEDDYKTFRKIGFTPCFVYEILDIEGYIRFIDDNSLGKSLANCLSRLHLLYKQLNKFYSFPPYDLIVNINSFFLYLERVNVFLEKLPEQINHHCLYNLVQIGKYLLELDYYKSHPSAHGIVRSKQIDNMLNEIPIKNVDKIAKIIPERYNESLKLVKDKLLKFGIDLDKINKAGIKGIEQGRLKERELYFTTYPKEIQEKIMNSLNEIKDSLKDKKIEF